MSICAPLAFSVFEHEEKIRCRFKIEMKFFGERQLELRRSVGMRMRMGRRGSERYATHNLI